MPTLYLIEVRSRGVYQCSACGQPITRGTVYFRHDPHPYARSYRGQKTSHWCRECILAADPGPKEQVTRRIRIPAVRVLSSAGRVGRTAELQPVQVEIIGVGSILTERLLSDPALVHRLSPGEFEEFVCDRLFAMGLEPKRVGPTNRRDGGIDIVFWPRVHVTFPFLGAAQVKHHREPNKSEGPSTVREFAGAIAGHPFNAGIIVTNTSFSADAEWFAREHAKLIRLRGFRDIQRWLGNSFDAEEEWREMPDSIELCPGVVVELRRRILA